MQPKSCTPLVSIIVPSFNQGCFIKETLDSILTQDYRPLEVIVMDGGSTDETVGVLQSCRSRELRWNSEPDDGVAHAVNKGLKEARGEIIGIQSSDDLYLPGAISAVVEFMVQRPYAAIAYGDVEYIDQHCDVLGRTALGPFDIRHFLGRFAYIPQPSAFFRSSVLKTVSGWRQEVSYAADADFWLRIACRYRVEKIDRLLGQYRYHADQRDTQRAKISRDWEATIRDLLKNFNLDASARRYARMGIYLAKYHYTKQSQWLLRTGFLYRAALASPRGLFDSRFPKRELLPGREPIWKFLSKAKRRMGLKPRGSERGAPITGKEIG